MEVSTISLAIWVEFGQDFYSQAILRQVYADYLSRVGHTHFALLEARLVRGRGQAFFWKMGITPILYQ